MIRIAAIVLAAGRASRFGAGYDDSKVVAPLDGKPLLVHVVATATASWAEPVVVVVGHAGDRAATAIAGLGTQIVRNADHAGGLASSLQAGIAALPASVDGALILLADMPLVASATLDRLIDAFASARPDAVVPIHDGRAGNPALIGRSLFAAAMTLTGDVGARALLADPRYRVVDCLVDDPGVLVDVDTREMLAALTRSRDA